MNYHDYYDIEQMKKEIYEKFSGQKWVPKYKNYEPIRPKGFIELIKDFLKRRKNF